MLVRERERERPKFICNRSNHGRHFRKKIWHLCKNPWLPLWFFSFWGVVGLARFFVCCNRVLTDFELQTKNNFEIVIVSSTAIDTKNFASSCNRNSNLEINHSFIFCVQHLFMTCVENCTGICALSIYWPDVIFSESLHTFACIRCRIRTPIFPFECKIRKLG